MNSAKQISAWLVKVSRVMKHIENEKTKSSFLFTRQACIQLSTQNLSEIFLIKVNTGSCNILYIYVYIYIFIISVNAGPFHETMLTVTDSRYTNSQNSNWKSSPMPMFDLSLSLVPASQHQSPQMEPVKTSQK